MLSTRFIAFDTTVCIEADTLETKLLADCHALCERYERMLSRFDPEGPLWALNHAGGKRMRLPEELARFLQVALRYCADSEGCFDITMGGVCKLWDFHEGIVPDEAAVAEALQHVSWRGVHVDETEAWLDDPQAWVDLGGIAKGYIADCVAQHLRSHGVSSGLVNLGGNILTIGSKPGGRPWRVGIRTPRSSAQSEEKAFALVEVRGKSVVTSGVYERAFEKNGVAYHHILDPKTGYPVQTDLVSATVISDRSIDGDGYSTTLVALGSERALRFAQERSEIEAVLLRADGELLISDGCPKIGLLG